MMPSRLPLAALVLLAVPVAALAANPHVLTVGKQATLRSTGGMVRVGADPLLAGLTPCAGGVAPRLTLSSYPQATMRVVTHVDVVLPCSGWKSTRGGWRYDGAAAGDGVERVVLGPDKLVVSFGGDGYTAPAGPVGYVQIWITQGADRYNARFHNFRRNAADLLVTRKPSKPAADGERCFWQVLHGEDTSTAREEACLASLARAAKRDRQDGRSRFLTGMMHLYRFGQGVMAYEDATADDEAELVAALAAFDEATPLLWDPVTQVGDSRAPGFVAAARYGLGRVRGDAALQAQGLAELEDAVDVNPFFNVFDLIPVAQAAPFDDPQFATVMARVTPYILDPNTFSCVGTQPEICGLDGMAPHNIAGSLLLFGDLFAKNGDPTQAAFFYQIGAVNDTPGYPFHDAVQARILPTPADAAAARAALWRDGDPTNDPFVIGAGAEACSACHVK
jgi:hypothetical protein